MNLLQMNAALLNLINLMITPGDHEKKKKNEKRTKSLVERATPTYLIENRAVCCCNLVRRGLTLAKRRVRKTAYSKLGLYNMASGGASQYSGVDAIQFAQKLNIFLKPYLS